MDAFPFKGKLPRQTMYAGQPSYVSIGMLGEDDDLAYGAGICKEYVLDYTMYTINSARSPYMATIKKVYLDEVRLVVLGMNDNVLAALDFINQFEEAIDYPISVVNRIPDNGVLFRGNKKWFISPPMLSLYALLVRSGRFHTLGDPMKRTFEHFYNEKGKDRSQDHAYHVQARKGVECILENGPEAIFGNDMKKNWPTSSNIHNQGICAFSQGALQSNFPDWYKLMGHG